MKKPAKKKSRKQIRRKGHKLPGDAGRSAAKMKGGRSRAAVPPGKKQEALRDQADKRDMAKLDAKVKADAETHRVAKELKPVAKEINVKIKLAAKLDGKADDHRLSAALLLESARRRCKEAKIAFEKWCENNVEKSYDEVRKLVAIAQTPQPAKALADLRSGAAARNRKLRARQKVSRDATAPASRAETPWEAADALVESLPDREALSLIEARAKPLGMVVVSETDANVLAQSKKDDPSEFATVDELESGFLSLKASDQYSFVQWAATQIGAEVAGDFSMEEHLTDIPDSLRVEP